MSHLSESNHGPKTRGAKCKTLISCCFCKKPIETGQSYHFLKPKRTPTRFFHADCWKGGSKP